MRCVPSATACESGVLFATSLSISVWPSQATGGSRPGIAALVENRVEQRPAREQELVAAEDVDGDDVQRGRRLLERLALRVYGASSRRRPLSPIRCLRAPSRPNSPGRGLSGNVCRRRTLRQTAASASAVTTVCGREAMKAPVDRAGGRPDDRIRGDVTLIQRLKHPDVHRSEAGSAGEQKEATSGLS